MSKDHIKTLELQEFLELTQKHTFSNIKCSLCKSNNISEISFCTFHKSFKCKKCVDKQCADHALISIENLDSTCLMHTLKNNINKNNTVPKKEVKIEKNNNIEMKKEIGFVKIVEYLIFKEEKIALNVALVKMGKIQHIITQQIVFVRIIWKWYVQNVHIGVEANILSSLYRKYQKSMLIKSMI